jgi:hydroxymethylpyrimidine/phosphomethylpyrimidine kinase
MLLVIAGNDPSGGAGLAADTQTATALGWHPLPVVTAITAQNTHDVVHVSPCPAQDLRLQLDVLLDDIAPDAVKIGLVPTAAAAEVIGAILARLSAIPIVVDPVLKAGGGGRLADDPVAAALHETLLPQATVITPNRFELQRLVAEDAGSTGTPAAQAATLAALRHTHVLVTGGDEAAEAGAPFVTNTAVLTDGRRRDWQWPRLAARYHGSGCTLSSALACTLGDGDEVLAAMDRAQRFTHTALQRGFRAGAGQHIPLRVLE